jgi:hypothetical protein
MFVVSGRSVDVERKEERERKQMQMQVAGEC